MRRRLTVYGLGLALVFGTALAVRLAYRADRAAAFDEIMPYQSFIAHRRAMRILVERNANRDPDCVPCHLVDVPHGDAAIVADEMGVGCEACHGGSAAHAADPTVRTPVRDGGRSTCASRCHHPPEVKEFDFAKQWPRIAHGPNPVPAAAGSR